MIDNDQSAVLAIFEEQLWLELSDEPAPPSLHEPIWGQPEGRHERITEQVKTMLKRALEW